MSQKELLDAICQQATLQTDQILTEARETADRIVKKAEAETGLIKDGIVSKARGSVRSEEARIINEARLENKKAVMKAKHEVMDAVQKGLQERIEKLSETKPYQEIMKHLLDECLAGAEGDITIYCRKADVPLLEKLAQGTDASVTIQEADLPLGGIDASWDGSRFTCKNSFESRLRKIHPELLKEASKLLFEPSET